ncbi:hypothetical protein ANTPLA_LOCUS4243 [Anthophora plagiata]
MTLQVSWVRHRDVHLLTIGSYTYTNDQRFRPIHNAHTDDWTLEIKYPQERDSGDYECQVSTTPHMSHIVHLDVIVNSNLNLPQFHGHCAKFKPSLNPGAVPIEHLGLVDTDFELSHGVEQGFDYARLFPQLGSPTGRLSSVFYSSRNGYECTRNTVNR